MTGINHALSGALIGAALPLPIAIPVAFISHFVIDTLPHYGIEERYKNKSAKWRWFMYIDTLVALSIGAIAAYFRKWNMEITGWVAFSPDLIWIMYYFKQNRSFQLKPKNRFMRFHRRIQNETPNGWVFELIMALILFPIFLIIVQK
jgi:hypothetical protein